MRVSCLLKFNYQTEESVSPPFVFIQVSRWLPVRVCCQCAFLATNSAGKFVAVFVLYKRKMNSCI